MKRKVRIFVLILTLVALVIVVNVRTWLFENFVLKYEEEQKGLSKTRVVFAGERRSYVTHVPEVYGKNLKMPLMIVLHGVGGNSEIAMKMTRMNEVADENNFIVAYPNGTGLFDNYVLSWNAGGCCNFIAPIGVDDVGFIQFVINEIAKEYNIDLERIYATGMSNGGMMTYRLGCELSETFASIAPVSGSMDVENCAPKSLMPIIVFHGTADETIPYLGGTSTHIIPNLFNLNFSSVSEAVSFWVEHNNCSPKPQTEQEGGFLKETFLCDWQDSDVEVYTIQDGGHVWPGGGKGWLLSPRPPENIVASEIIWNFFEKHAKNNQYSIINNQ